MIEQRGDLWSFHDAGEWCAITTNGDVNARGLAIMGRGVARDAATRYPELPRHLGVLIASTGNVARLLPVWRLAILPVKHHWHEAADVALIERSARALVSLIGGQRIGRCYLPRAGCGNGRLLWSTVRPVLAPILDERFTVLALPWLPDEA